MAFGREFSKYLPGTADILVEGIKRRKAEEERRKATAAAIAPFQTDIPQPFDTPNFDPEAAARSSIAHQIRTPGYADAFTRAGGSAGDFISLLRQMPLGQQRDAADLVNRLEVRHISGGELNPHEMEILYAFGKLKRPEAPDPLAEAEKVYMTPERAAEVVRQKYEGKPQVPTITTPEQAYDAYRKRLITRAEYEDAKRELTGIEREKQIIKKEGQGDKTEKTPLTPGQGLNEVQERLDKTIAQLRGQLYDTIDRNSATGEERWKGMSKEEQRQWTQSPEYPGYYYKLRDDAPDNKVAELREAERRRLDFADQKRSVDSLQAIMAMPSAEDMAAEMGLTGPDLQEAVNDPDFPMVYEAWKREQSAGLR